jgi:hypothetical protein
MKVAKNIFFAGMLIHFMTSAKHIVDNVCRGMSVLGVCVIAAMPER